MKGKLKSILALAVVAAGFAAWAATVPAISAKSAKFTVDLRGEIALAKGAVTVAGVNYSDTAWGAADEAAVTLGYTNETTGATGGFKADVDYSSLVLSAGLQVRF